MADTAKLTARATAYLEVDDDAGTRHPIRELKFRIGRQDDNDLCIDDESVSRYHAEIQRRPDGTFIIVDLDSLNGVYINDEKRRAKILTDSDRIELGDIVVRFVMRKPSDPTDGPVVTDVSLDEGPAP